MALGVTASVERSDRSGRAGLWLLAIILLAAALRFWRLGDWGFESTEMFTLRDSNNPRFSNPRPLIYFLNYLLVRPVCRPSTSWDCGSCRRSSACWPFLRCIS